MVNSYVCQVKANCLRGSRQLLRKMHQSRFLMHIIFQQRCLLSPTTHYKLHQERPPQHFTSFNIIQLKFQDALKKNKTPRSRRTMVRGGWNSHLQCVSLWLGPRGFALLSDSSCTAQEDVSQLKTFKRESRPFKLWCSTNYPHFQTFYFIFSDLLFSTETFFST